MKKKKSHRYWMSVTVLLVAALVLGTVSLGTALQVKGLDWFSGLIDVRPFDLVFIGAGAGVIALLAIIVYLMNLRPYHLLRPLTLVFLNFMAPCLYAALGAAAYDRGSNGDVTMLTLAGAPAIALLPPLLLLGLETLLHRTLRGLGRMAHGRHWNSAAVSFMKAALAFRPSDRPTRLACGLLYVQDEECAQGLRLLEPIAQAESGNEQFLKALEHCYRAQGRPREALQVLQQMNRLKPGQAALERRILDDFVRLEMHREALDLLENGHLKMTMELLQLAEKLNLALGNYAQAMALIRQLAAEESRPHNLAIRLYRELMERLPEQIEVQVNLGLLLLDNDIEERRREGSTLLEAVLEKDPHRLHLARQLIHYYNESGLPQEANRFLKALVEAGDPDPEYHLAYVQALTDEERYDEAVQVLARIIKRWPMDWRGPMRLARVLLAMDKLDEAEKALAQAGTVAPEEAGAMLDSVRGALAQRRRELFIKSMREDVARNNSDIEKRLQLVAHQIDMEWIDEALAECDRLLDEKPALLPTIVAHIERGLRKAPRSYSLRDYLSDIYLHEGRLDEALQLYREMAEQSLHPNQVLSDGCRLILERDPKHMEARRELALARRREEDWAGVLAALDQPIHDNEPLPAEDKVLWVEAAFRLWRLDGAVRVGMTLVDDLIDEPGFLLMLLDILMAANEFEKAMEVYQRARAANPNDQRLARLENKVVTGRARARLSALQRQFTSEGDLSAAEHYEKAELHRALGQNEEAIVHYQRAAYDEALLPLATAKLADTLCDRGMYDLADETLNPLELSRELAISHPEIKDLFYRVGRVMEKLRRFDQAAKYYKRIFRVDAAYEDIVERIERLT